MAVTVGVVWGIAVFDDANATNLERSGRSGVTRSEHPPIMHLAMLEPTVGRFGTAIDDALRRHGLIP